MVIANGILVGNHGRLPQTDAIFQLRGESYDIRRIAANNFDLVGFSRLVQIRPADPVAAGMDRKEHPADGVPTQRIASGSSRRRLADRQKERGRWTGKAQHAAVAQRGNEIKTGVERIECLAQRDQRAENCWLIEPMDLSRFFHCIDGQKSGQPSGDHGVG